MNPYAIHANLGRGYLYQLYLEEPELVKQAVFDFNEAFIRFGAYINEVKNLTPISYSRVTHQFVSIPYGDFLNWDTEDLWNRDQIIFRIDQFARTLFSENPILCASVKALLYKKSTGGLLYPEYIERGDLRNYAHLTKFFRKIEEDRFLSSQEKREKRRNADLEHVEPVAKEKRSKTGWFKRLFQVLKKLMEWFRRLFFSFLQGSR